jgi:beta-lactamase regulating signal transducer with metallopeptidase domain
MLWFALRSVVIFALAWGVTALLRRRSASMRHLIWLAAFVAVVAMPAFSGMAAKVEVRTPPSAAKILAPIAPQLVRSPDPKRSVAGTIGAMVIPPVTDQPEPDRPGFDPYALVASLYWTGLAIIAARYVSAWRSLRRAVRHSRLMQVVPNGIQVRIVEAGYLASPATFGWSRATILLPIDYQAWPEERRQAALDHELAHVERADWVWQILALGTCAVQWFNPLAWLAASRLRAEAEGAADDAVLAKGLAAPDYAQELIQVARGVRRNTLLAVPIARPGGVAARIRAILDRNRDRRPATHPAHLAAGTGTLFTAAILGGLGLSAAASSPPVADQDPFQVPLNARVGLSITEVGATHVFDDGSFGVYQVQVRPKGGREEGWDSMGRLNFVEASRIPRAPVIPGRKVREIAVACPSTRFLSARVPEGAEILQIARENGYGIVTASFPVNAKVSPIDLGYPMAPGARVRILPVKPVIGPDGKRLSPYLAWFAVPSVKEEVQYRVFDKAGKAVPVKGQFSRRGNPENFIAVDVAKAKTIAKVEECLLVPDWQTFSPLLLDPAPTQPLRPDAPEVKISLPGGAEMTILRIESRTPGVPFRSWAIDGGPPRMDYNRSLRSWMSLSERDYLGRTVIFRLTEVPKTGNPSMNWIIDAPMKSRGSGFSYSGKGNEGRVEFEIPKPQKEVVLHLDYAYEAYQEIANEPLGGSVLKSTAKVIEDVNINGKSTVEVDFTPPQAVEKMDLAIEGYDARGKLLDLNSIGGSSYDGVSKTYDYSRKAWFEMDSPSQIARLRLKARPFHRVTIPPLPMHPR